jgi:formate hydrogenlyase subunit 3/multisubunit Na+/H+ antiporter MnhD subunit
MEWDRKLRLAAWACFALMWASLGIFIIHHPQDPSFEDMIPVIAFLVLLFAFVILLVLSFFLPLFIASREDKAVRDKGTLVPAVVTAVADTGMYINKQPVLEMAIMVHPPHEAAFNATVRRIIPFSAITQVQPGAKLEVYYIPGTTRVALPE